MRAWVLAGVGGAIFLLGGKSASAGVTYGIDQAVAEARAHNPEIAIARKKVEAAEAGIIEARSGYLPALVTTGLLREREHQSNTRLRDEDYNASLRLVQPVYDGGATSSALAIARLNLEKQQLDLEALTNRVEMDVRVAFHELLLNRARIKVHEQSVAVLQEQVKTQKDELSAGRVGQLNVRRAEVALANEQPELINAQMQAKNSEIRLSELLGMVYATGSPNQFDVAGQLQYQPRHPDLNECLARADSERPEIKSAEKAILIEDRQYELDRAAVRPTLEAFTGYEVYSENDPLIGQEFNHGYVVGLNARWHIFDGWATKGRLAATRARRAAAVEALRSARMTVASDVRNAILDLEQSDQVLASETRNVQNADESLELAKANLGAGLGTQLDVLQAATDVTRTRTTRLTAIYQHNVAMARLARACATAPDKLDFAMAKKKGQGPVTSAIADLTGPPKKLTQR